VVDAALDVFAGTAKPYIHISGLWIYGDNTSISEESPFKPPALGSSPIRLVAATSSGMD